MKILLSLALVFGLVSVSAATPLQIAVDSSGNKVVVSNNQIQTYVVREKVVDFAYPYGLSSVAVPVTSLGLEYYYRVITEEELNRQAQVIAAEVVRQLEEAYPNGLVPSPTPPVEDEPDEPKPDVGWADGYTPTELDTQVYALIKTKCAGCHTGPTPDGGLVLITENGKFPKFDGDTRAHIWDRVDGSNLPIEKIMPKNGAPLGDDEVNLVRKWWRELK